MKLSTTQIAALQLIKEKPANFYDFMHIGANGSTIGSLVRNGLAEKIDNGLWALTELGYAELNDRGL